jgi:hypothetical protein
MEELERKRLHPYRLHPEMWYNDSGEVCLISLVRYFAALEDMDAEVEINTVCETEYQNVSQRE